MGEPPPQASLLVKLGLIGAACLVLGTCAFVLSPKTMSVKEFVQQKKSSFHMRGFRIRGEVESVSKGGGFFTVQSSDGRTMGSIKIVQDDEFGYVTFDPEGVAELPKAGDKVEITGSFESISSFTTPGKMSKTTIARLTGLEIVEAAPAGSPD